MEVSLNQAELILVRYALSCLNKDNDKEYQLMLSPEWESLRMKLIKELS